MRRNARRMRRIGVQPIASITDDLELAPMIIATIGRAMWRYRSELAPLTLAALLMAAAMFLHANYRPWWPTIAGTAALVAVAVLVGGQWINLSRPIERGYAAVATAFVGGWLAASTAYGPLPLVLGVGAVLLAIPWWAHRRRRARVRVERTLAAWPNIAEAVALAGSRVQSALVDVWGYRFRLALGPGQTVEDAIAKVPALESALGAKRGAVRVQPIPTREANRADVRVIETDPHADAITWPGPSISSITQPIKIGLFEDGTPVRVSLLRRHALFGGATGAGKSGGMNVLLGELTACSDVIIWGIDLKGGMELMPWAACLDRLATTPQEAEALLADGVTILDGRADHLARAGERVWTPSPTMPELFIVIDEYAELVDEAPNAIRHADSIARRGRAPGVQLVAATQRPTQKAMGKGVVRSQMDVRLSFRVREQRDVDLILGPGMLKTGWHAHRLDAPGKFLISATEHDSPRRARAYLLADAHVQTTADRHAAHRPQLDVVSATALERASQPIPDDNQPQPPRHARSEAIQDAEQALEDALKAAPSDGVSVGDLITATGMGRRWVYYRLDELARSERAVQITRGRWRAEPHNP
ncbi:cell division protein FtsK [Nonomuraea endophytica]|uniref:S-DNA-T family DNA segregation ATPase FtsK/SpoIIIE n=1 Tax=Nonomuraea endophytica TaxID=714136 RepID=A0A7W8A1I3_9ACTN|nr:cell division protein FtsK [Nonomuraea endophytica]MBB5077774.1 S-DNA-T family DNA segregation ATPase FtsK/SpoIIIE [Nonomuraea endophytica]